MTVRLAAPPVRYDLQDQSEMRRSIEQALSSLAANIQTINAEGAPGVGTAGKIPVWGPGNTLVDSSMTESAGVITFGARPKVGADSVAYLSELFTQTMADTRYKPIGYVPSWGSITGVPTTIAGYGITDYNSLGDARWLKLAGGALTGALTGTTAEFSGSITLPNGVPLYGRRATGNTQVGLLRYDTGTDDISMVLGGTNMRWRDTGSGVPMLLTSAGLLDVLSQYNIGGVALATFASSYNMLYRRDGVIGIYLGGADPSNYYDNTTHIFRDRTAANALVLSPTTATFAGTVRSTSTYGWVMGDITSVGRIRYGASAASSFDFLTAANGYADVYVKDVFGTTLRGTSAVLSSLLNLTGGSGSGGDSYVAGITSAGSIVTGSAAGDLAFRTNGKKILFSVDTGSTAVVTIAGTTITLASGAQVVDSFGNALAAIHQSASVPGTTSAADNTLWIKS